MVAQHAGMKDEWRGVEVEPSNNKFGVDPSIGTGSSDTSSWSAGTSLKSKLEQFDLQDSVMYRKPASERTDFASARRSSLRGGWGALTAACSMWWVRVVSTEASNPSRNLESVLASHAGYDG